MSPVNLQCNYTTSQKYKTMRNLLKTGLVSVALLATVVVNASEKLNVKVAPASKMLAIELTEVVDGETISIKDLDGEVLFFEKLSKSSEYSKVFSFSTLPQGLYFVESKEAAKIQVTPVIINESGVAIVENASKTYTAPKVSLDGDILNVKVRNYGKAPVTISIYNELGALLTKTESNTNALVFGSFSTANVEAEKLTVSVTEGDYNFVEEVKL